MKSFPSMAKFLFIVLSLSTFGIAWGAGPSAEDYLHGGAGKYIQGRLQEASVEVDEGLSHYPNDSRLKALATQLKSMKDQKKKDQGSSGSQGGEDPNQKQDKKDSSGQGSQQKKDQDQKDKEKQKQKEEQQKKDEEKGKDQAKQAKQDQGKEDKDKGDSSGQAPAPAKPGQMSKEEAERLLNSYQDDEKREHQQMQQRQRKATDVEKDW